MQNKSILILFNLDISEKIYLLHKKSLPDDPIHLFESKKIKCFLRSLYNLKLVKLELKKKEIICVSIVVPLYKLTLFVYVIFLATFYRSLKYHNENFKNAKKFCGILVYLFVKKEFRGNLIGSNILNSYKNDGIKHIFFVTKESTYKSFYKKFEVSRINIFGKCFCHLTL